MNTPSPHRQWTHASDDVTLDTIMDILSQDMSDSVSRAQRAGDGALRSPAQVQEQWKENLPGALASVPSEACGLLNNLDAFSQPDLSTGFDKSCAAATSTTRLPSTLGIDDALRTALADFLGGSQVEPALTSGPSEEARLQGQELPGAAEPAPAFSLPAWRCRLPSASPPPAQTAPRTTTCPPKREKRMLRRSSSVTSDLYKRRMQERTRLPSARLQLKRPSLPMSTSCSAPAPAPAPKAVDELSTANLNAFLSSLGPASSPGDQLLQGLAGSVAPAIAFPRPEADVGDLPAPAGTATPSSLFSYGTADQAWTTPSTIASELDSDLGLNYFDSYSLDDASLSADEPMDEGGDHIKDCEDPAALALGLGLEGLSHEDGMQSWLQNFGCEPRLLSLAAPDTEDTMPTPRAATFPQSAGTAIKAPESKTPCLDAHTDDSAGSEDDVPSDARAKTFRRAAFVKEPENALARIPATLPSGVEPAFIITDRIALLPRDAKSREGETLYPSEEDASCAQLLKRKAQPPPEEETAEGGIQEQFTEEEERSGQTGSYAPRYTRQAPTGKEGWCPLCEEGGWYSMKRSQYLYHLQYHHGISAQTHEPFPAPERLRIWKDANRTTEGMCGSCGCWVPICFGRIRKCSFMAWWKHCAKRCDGSEG